MKVLGIVKLPTVERLHFFSTKSPVTYSVNGVRKHTVSLNDAMYDPSDCWKKYAEFVDILGNVTDEFYGSASDFNLWFLSKCAKNERFFVICYPNGSCNGNPHRVVGVDGWLGSASEHRAWSRQKFVQNDDMSWSMA